MHTTNLLLLAIVALSSVGFSSALDRKLHTRKKTLKNTRRNSSNNEKNSIMDEEDVAFWTRHLQGERGKETGVPDFSLPSRPRPPSPSPPSPVLPLPTPVTPRPTRRSTPPPTRRTSPTPPAPTPPAPTPPAPTPPTPTAPTFRCPNPGLVGCTAPDPTNPVDECSTIGEPCSNGIEFCCQDQCPRKYCTAKQAPAIRE